MHAIHQRVRKTDGVQLTLAFIELSKLLWPANGLPFECLDVNV